MSSAKSLLLPKLNQALMVRCMDAPSQTAAVKELRQALRSAPRKHRKA